MVEEEYKNQEPNRKSKRNRNININNQIGKNVA